jgi:hypothetical protein
MRISAPIALALSAVLGCGVILGASRLLEPKYMESLYEGAMTAEYYDDAHVNEVIFIGDCEVYENYSPITMWEDYGITSYIRGGPAQTVWQSYYILKDTLQHEKPDVVVLNALAMHTNAPVSEPYNRLNLDGMKASAIKWEAARASMTDDETISSYVFPLLRYHERWSELSGEDLEYYFNKDHVSHSGYFMRSDVKPVGVIPDAQPLADYRFSEKCYDYLDRIRELCEENDIDLVLVKAPTIYPYWYSEWNEQINEYAEKYDLLYVNFLDYMQDAGIDLSTDTYDAGLHLNRAGAEKLAKYFGSILKDRFGLADMRDNPIALAAWDKKVAAYDAMAIKQDEEIVTFGEIRTYTYK